MRLYVFHLHCTFYSYMWLILHTSYRYGYLCHIEEWSSIMLYPGIVSGTVQGCEHWQFLLVSPDTVVNRVCWSDTTNVLDDYYTDCLLFLPKKKLSFYLNLCWTVIGPTGNVPRRENKANWTFRGINLLVSLPYPSVCPRLVLWLMFSISLRITWANGIGSGETTRMRRLTWTFAVRLCYNGSFPMTRSNSESILLKGLDGTWLTWLFFNEADFCDVLFNFFCPLMSFRKGINIGRNEFTPWGANSFLLALKTNPIF